MPSKFTCEGENINPELKISGVGANAKSLVLIMDDLMPQPAHGCTGTYGTLIPKHQ